MKEQRDIYLHKIPFMLKKKWLVFYTKSRNEKSAYKNLLKFGFEPYLPLQKVLRQWSDRKKKVELPLFNSYIFVRDHESRIPDILQIPGVSWNIRHNQKPAVLRDKELDTIKRFIESGLTIEIGSVEDLEKGDQVKIMDGPLRGAIGYLSGEYNEQKFTIEIESIDQVMKVSIDKRLLKKL
ncbi:MAG: UpxY family transcription antiterminator [Bacteroidota bacterium]